MSDHADTSTWTIGRLLFATQLPFLLLALVVFAAAVLVLTIAIAVAGTLTRSVWDPAVTVVRWFAFGYGLYLVNRLLPVYVAHGRTRREFLRSVALFLVVAAAVLAGLLALGLALEGVLYQAMGWPQGLPDERLYGSPGEYPLVFLTYWAMLLSWTVVGMLLAAGFYRSGGSELVVVPLALGMVLVGGFAVGVSGLPFVGQLADLADVPLTTTLALCAAGLLPGAATLWTLVRDMPIRDRTV